MNHTMRPGREGERGFTLFELVIVLAIIGILVAVALPAYRGARFRGFISEARTAANEWRQLVFACRQEKQGFTASCDTSAEIGFTGTSTNWSYNMSTANAPTSVIFTAVGASNDTTGKTYTLTLDWSGTITEVVPNP